VTENSLQVRQWISAAEHGDENALESLRKVIQTAADDKRGKIIIFMAKAACHYIEMVDRERAARQ